MKKYMTTAIYKDPGEVKEEETSAEESTEEVESTEGAEEAE